MKAAELQAAHTAARGMRLEGSPPGLQVISRSAGCGEMWRKEA
jgi:hypothetical protein